jgi:rhodanese-related sulfurtransferase
VTGQEWDRTQSAGLSVDQGSLGVPHGMCPVARLETKPEFTYDETDLIYRASGGLFAFVANVAMDMGAELVVNLDGDVAAWKQAGVPLE